MALNICEGIWLTRLLVEQRILVEMFMKMFCDNQVAIRIAKNSFHHNKTKHVEIDCHFIKNLESLFVFTL